MKTGSKLSLLESSHVFSKSWPYDLVFETTWPNFGTGLDLIQINILTKFHEDCIKTMPFEVCVWPSFKGDIDLMDINILAEVGEV